MTTAQIETAADRGNISGGDMNLKQILRRKVIPEFFEDVDEIDGRVAWRRKSSVLTTAVGTQVYAAPADFLRAQALYLPTELDHSLQYIGDDPDRFARAEVASANAAPSGYYIVESSGSWKSIKLQAPANAVLGLLLVYYRYANFADDSTDTNMAQFLPESYHWTLVEGLRTEIFVDRFGQGDPRYVASLEAYRRGVARAAGLKEFGERSHASYVR